MGYDNSVTVCGNVTRDPEMKFTPSGIAQASFGIAVSKRWRNKQTDEWEEQTSFFNIQTWRQLAENVSSTVTKGMRIVVTGELQQRSWETESGDKRSVVQITADDVAPSLRYATADIHKVDRERGGQAPEGGNNGGNRGGSSRPKKQEDYNYKDYSEEPF